MGFFLLKHITVENMYANYSCQCECTDCICTVYVWKTDFLITNKQKRKLLESSSYLSVTHTVQPNGYQYPCLSFKKIYCHLHAISCNSFRLS